MGAPGVFGCSCGLSVLRLLACPVPATAYEILSDSKKREVYDRYGEEGLKQHQAREASGQGRGGGDIFDM